MFSLKWLSSNTWLIHKKKEIGDKKKILRQTISEFFCIYHLELEEFMK